MFFSSFDMSSTVVLAKENLSIKGVLKSLSEALNCNVFIDGLIDEVLPRAGYYRASDLLDTVSKLWSCSWRIEEGNVYLVRDFARENQFPDISLGEIKEFAGAVSSKLAQKYGFAVGANSTQVRKELMREIRTAVGPAEREKLESRSGIRIGLLKPALQDRVKNMLYAREISSTVNSWGKLNTDLQDLNSLELQTTGPTSVRIQAAGKGPGFVLSLKPAKDSAAVDALHQRLAKQSDSHIGSYVGAEGLKTPDLIRGHFVAGAVVVSDIHFCRGLAKINKWQCSASSGQKITLETKKQSEQDDVLSLLPEEYRRYIAAGVNKRNALYTPPRMEVMLATYRFSQESELLSGVLQKLLTGRTELKLRTATELEKYVVARLMLSEVLQRSLGPALLVDAYPEGQLTDYKNAYLRYTADNIYGVSYYGESMLARTPLPATRRLFGGS